MAKFKGKNASIAVRRPTAEVILRMEVTGKQSTALGHLDEVNELRKGGTKITSEWGGRRGGLRLVGGGGALITSEWGGLDGRRGCGN